MGARHFYLDKAAVCEAVALSKSTVEKLVRENEFPEPRVLSGRRVAWLVREIEEWGGKPPGFRSATAEEHEWTEAQR